MENLIMEEKNGVITITFNRPKKLNALSSGVLGELKNCLKRAAGAACCVFTGAGEKAFVAGADISEMQDMTADEFIAFSNYGRDIFNELSNMDTIFIAAVNGYALGGGTELVLACDMCIASENAQFGLPESGLGILPGYGGLQRLPLLVGTRRAMELLLCPERLTAQRAYELGIVNRVTAREALLSETTAFAEKIAALPPKARAGAKKAVYARCKPAMSTLFEMDEKLNHDCFGAEEREERMRAFCAR